MKTPNEKRAMQDLMHRIAASERRRGSPVARDAAPGLPPLVSITLSALVDSTEDNLELGGFYGVVNLLGRPLWNASKVLLYGDPVDPYIFQSNAASVVLGEWNGSGSKTSIESYNNLTGVDGHFDNTDVDDDTFVVTDNAVLTSATTTGDLVYFLAGPNTGADPEDPQNVLTPIRYEPAGSGSTLPPWTGWPDPDPTTGLSAVVIATAFINNAAGYDSGDATMDFDGAVARVGSLGGTTDGTATNAAAKAFCDNEPILIVRDNGGTWHAFKLDVNIIVAQVNEATGVAATDTEFDFDNATAKEGTAPSGGTGVATNVLGVPWADNEKFIAIQQDDGKWLAFPLQAPGVIKGEAVGAQDETATTFSIDNIEVVQGKGPTGSSVTVIAEPPVYVENNGVVFARWDKTQNAGAGGWTTADAGNFDILEQAWLRLQDNFDEAEKQLFTNDAGTFEWNDIATVLNWLAGYTAGNDQSIGHDASDSTEWQDDTDCP